MQVFLKSATEGEYGANMGFFQQLSGGGFQLHFLGRSDEEKKDFWYSMRFDTDFIKVLKKYGSLPPVTVKDLVAEKTALVEEKNALIAKQNAPA